MTTNPIHKKALELAADFQEIALQIHDHPETSNHEFFASRILSEKLKEEGFEIELPAAGHRTGFAARYDSGKPGPVIVYLAEYDALAGLGHGCGHNLYGAASSLAGVLSKDLADRYGGEIRVYGTPGEEGGENGSAKASFVREGYLDDVDFALGVHPGSQSDHGLSRPNFACAPYSIEFFGKSAHAAGSPQDGVNALDAQILVYNAISALRQQLPSSVRIHGIIDEGGLAPNVIPDYTRSRYYIRAADIDTLHEVRRKVEGIVQGAALATGCTSKMELYQNLVENMVVTPSFDSIFKVSLESLGESVSEPLLSVAPGSSDVGNISQVVPTIQPNLSITDEPVAGHSPKMVEASRSSKGLAFIPLAASAMALTAKELYENPEARRKIQEEHAWKVSHQKEAVL